MRFSFFAQIFNWGQQVAAAFRRTASSRAARAFPGFLTPQIHQVQMSQCWRK